MSLWLILSPYLFPFLPFPAILTFVIAILLVTQRNHLSSLNVHPLSWESILSPSLCPVCSFAFHSFTSGICSGFTSYCVLSRCDLASDLHCSPLLSSHSPGSLPLCLLLSLLSDGWPLPFCTLKPVPTPSTLSHLFVSFKGLGDVHALCPPQSPQWRASANC